VLPLPDMSTANHLVRFIVLLYRRHLDLPSFPTRRSSDLLDDLEVPSTRGLQQRHPTVRVFGVRLDALDSDQQLDDLEVPSTRGRSEEHTSELQSRREIVCRLLLEKKKNASSGAQAIRGPR